jgi:RNA polymerase sigma-70 factor (ECF subfamily)
LSDALDLPEGTDRRQLITDLVEQWRPELHRYCSRLMGSIIEGEDVVQDALAKALVATNDLPDLPSLRAWLFRVAHNRALDLLRARSVRMAEPIEVAEGVVDNESSDPMEVLLHEEATQAAMARFMEIPIPQRSVLILKDVLDEPLADIADLLGLTLDSVKAHLSRGRVRLREANLAEYPVPKVSAVVAHYVSLFNNGDWNGLRALLASDVQLKQSSYPIRKGAADVGNFFGAYEKIGGIWLVPAWLEGREVIAVFERRGAPTPCYLMWLEWNEGRICFIHDYRYVPYITTDAKLTLVENA